MYKAQFLAVSLGLYLGLQAASNLHAKDIPGFKRQARTMKSLLEEGKRMDLFSTFYQNICAVTKARKRTRLLTEEVDQILCNGFEKRQLLTKSMLSFGMFF